VPLHPTQTRKERILSYGPPGSGKSKVWRDIADAIAETGAKSKMYVCDTDHAWESQCPAVGDNRLANIVVPREVYDYDTWKSTLTEFRLSATPEDWLVLDMADQMWQKSNDDFFSAAYETEAADFFVNARKTGESIGGEWGGNYQAINAMYGALINRVKTWPGHVLACTPAKEVRIPDPKTGRGGDPEAILALYSRVGMKPSGPSGQKDMTFEYSTVLFHQQVHGKNPGWTVTTVKERSSPEQPREMLGGARVEPNFVATYLYGVAKWRP
jgi:AAA domain